MSEIYLSVVVPVYNEEGAIADLHREIVNMAIGLSSFAIATGGTSDQRLTARIKRRQPMLRSSSSMTDRKIGLRTC
jgi:hypothetical protein